MDESYTGNGMSENYRNQLQPDHDDERQNVSMWGSGSSSHSSTYFHVSPAIPQFGGYIDEGFIYASKFTMKILCPAVRVGSIIGKGGEIVKELERQYGVCIKVGDESVGDEERVVSISSREVPSSPVSPTIKVLLELQLRCSTSQGSEITTRLLVERKKAGCIFGPRAAIINSLRTLTRANIQVHTKGNNPKYTSGDEFLVQIAGNPSMARLALSEIASRLRAKTLGGGNAASRPSPPQFLHRYYPSGNMLAQYPLSQGNASLGPDPSTGFHGFSSSDSLSGRMLQPFTIFGRGYPPGYEYPEVANKAYHGVAPSAMRYPEVSRSFDTMATNSLTSAYVTSGNRIYGVPQISGARSQQYDPFSSYREYPPDAHGAANPMRSTHNFLQDSSDQERQSELSLPEAPFY